MPQNLSVVATFMQEKNLQLYTLSEYWEKSHIGKQLFWQTLPLRGQSSCTWQPWPTSKLVLVTKKDSGWRTHCQGFQKLAKELEKVEKGWSWRNVWGPQEQDASCYSEALYRIVSPGAKGSHEPAQTSW